MRPAKNTTTHCQAARPLPGALRLITPGAEQWEKLFSLKRAVFKNRVICRADVNKPHGENVALFSDEG